MNLNIEAKKKNTFDAIVISSGITSVGNQNPSLTFMALTARAANYAVEDLKRRDL